MELLKVSGLKVSYSDEEIIHGIDFSLNKGEIHAIVGESGCGKSTLLKTILKILPEKGVITSGKIEFLGEDLVSLEEKQMRKIRGERIAIILQEPGGTLDPVKKIGGQFTETLLTHKDISKEEAREIALDTLAKMKLSDPAHILESYPFELSGGMKQRVAIAMAMSLHPDILLADEPTSALDAVVQSSVIDEMVKLRDIFDTSVIMVTHNISIAAYMADRITVMYKGQTVEEGSSEEVIKRVPSHPYTELLIESVPAYRKPIRASGISIGEKPRFEEQGCLYADRCPYRFEACGGKQLLNGAGGSHRIACAKIAEELFR